MKKLLSACAVAAAFVSAPAMAQGYIGLGLGSSSISGYDQTVLGAKFSGGDTTKTSFKILGGYNYTPNWGVEVQYTALGKRAISVTPTLPGTINTNSLDFSQLGLYGTGTLPVNGSFSLFGKLGLSANSGKATDTGGGSDSETNTSLSFGVGASYKLTPNLTVRAEYEDFGKVIKADPQNNIGDVKASNFSVSLLYRF